VEVMNGVRVERVATAGGLQALDLGAMDDGCGIILNTEAIVLYSRGCSTGSQLKGGCLSRHGQALPFKWWV
jgi:hypothetical protein